MMKQYDSYKDSGVNWIGEVPEHWEVIKTSLIFPNVGSGTTPSTSNPFYYTENGDGYFWLQTGDLNDGIISDTSKKVTDLAVNECNLKFYPVDSVVIAMYGATIGKVGVLKIETATNQACCVLPHSNKMIPNFSFYLYQSAKAPLLFEAMGGGQPNISQDIIKRLRVPVPPLSEQISIANYLDMRCGEIDKAIAIQAKRVELLKELRQNIITQAVTRGINPNAPLKDSGVEWIGEVPEYWEVMMLKRCAKIKTGCTPPTKEDKYYESEDIDWFTPSDIGEDYVLEAEKKISDTARKEGVCRMFPANIVYFVGIGATIGKVSYCEIEASSNQQINAIIPNKRAYYKYVSYCLKSQKDEIYLTANTVTLPIINQERTGSLMIPVPPLSEQQEIVSYIESQTARLDKSIEKAEHQIELLQELKQSIITEVVTGKRKVD